VTLNPSNNSATETMVQGLSGKVNALLSKIFPAYMKQKFHRVHRKSTN
jgi:hypothetical protein